MASAFFAADLPAVSTGWGAHDRDALHILSLTSTTNAHCLAWLPEYETVIYDWTLCMIPPPGQAICDFGNPLVAGGQIVGVNIWDAVCDGSRPSMHERVHHFRGWIETMIA